MPLSDGYLLKCGCQRTQDMMLFDLLENVIFINNTIDEKKLICWM